MPERRVSHLSHHPIPRAADTALADPHRKRLPPSRHAPRNDTVTAAADLGRGGCPDRTDGTGLPLPGWRREGADRASARCRGAGDIEPDYARSRARRRGTTGGADDQGGMTVTPLRANRTATAVPGGNGSATPRSTAKSSPTAVASVYSTRAPR